MKGPNSNRRSRGHRGNGRRPGFHGRGSTFESNGPEGKIRGDGVPGHREVSGAGAGRALGRGPHRRGELLPARRALSPRGRRQWLGSATTPRAGPAGRPPTSRGTTAGRGAGAAGGTCRAAAGGRRRARFARGARAASVLTILAGAPGRNPVGAVASRRNRTPVGATCGGRLKVNRRRKGTRETRKPRLRSCRPRNPSPPSPSACRRPRIPTTRPRPPPRTARNGRGSGSASTVCASPISPGASTAWARWRASRGRWRWCSSIPAAPFPTATRRS